MLTSFRLDIQHGIDDHAIPGPLFLEDFFQAVAGGPMF